MNKDTKDIIELVLLGIIAATLIFGSFGSGSTDNQTVAENATPNTNQPATQPNPQVQPNPLNPTGKPNQTPMQQITTVSYDNEMANLGALEKGSKKQHTFVVTNTGSNPLTFSGVSADAGMTIVSRPAAPIPPNGTGEIKVEFTADGEPGANVSKLVHVNSNATNSHTHLTVQATVK